MKNIHVSEINAHRGSPWNGRSGAAQRRIAAVILAGSVGMLPCIAIATVNVNTAQQSELERTKGLDKVKAKAIIEWRAANGSIDNFTELQQVPGFTPELIDKMKPQLAFSGDPYVPPPKAAKSAKKSSATTLASANPSRQR